MRRSLNSRSFAAVLTTALLAACKGGAIPSAIPMPDAAQNLVKIGQLNNPSDKIDHVVIIVQENRSFNDLFYGFPGAKTAKYGLDSNNQKIELQPLPLSQSWDLQHNSQGFELACNGTGTIPGTDCQMNGFDQEYWGCNKPSAKKCPIKYPPYSYVRRTDVAPYLSMARQYVLADEMYTSNFDTSSYVSHQYIIAGQAHETVDYPLNGNWGCPGGPTDKIWTLWTDGPKERTYKPSKDQLIVCFDYNTLGDELDGKGYSWAFYANPLGVGGPGKYCGTKVGPAYGERGIWSSYQAVKHICYGPDWDKDIITPPTQFLTDVGNGELRDVTWITPTCAASDHPGKTCVPDTGPSWVASVVNAIGKSKLWKSTAIFLFWDDYGGFYDAEKPQLVDYDGLGIRVPLVIISPYAKKGWVS
ncbi:MAG TPA: alkaline phosphatase family protein, partial [Candidatus Cybelea sp.]|nr:alkaline phosphatase family protein [Candidatus Cybelea sp.]